MNKTSTGQKALVIPDVHLKPWMFKRATELMSETKPDIAVCLMDIPDDWGQGMNINLYEDTFDAAIEFEKSFPGTLWCWGNHDLSYQWGCMESGYSPFAESTVLRKLREFHASLNSEHDVEYVHRVGNVLFSHGGVTKNFVWKFIPSNAYGNIDLVVTRINDLTKIEMWVDGSPIWARPQMSQVKMYSDHSVIQVVGHTPVEKISREGNVISCDTFSTYRNGTPIGSQEFLVIDCETGEWYGIK